MRRRDFVFGGLLAPLAVLGRSRGSDVDTMTEFGPQLGRTARLIKFEQLLDVELEKLPERIRTIHTRHRELVQKDDALAWAIHCNIAQSVLDEMPGLEQRPGPGMVNLVLLSNKAAARHMRAMYDVDSLALAKQRGQGWDEVEKPKLINVMTIRPGDAIVAFFIDPHNKRKLAERTGWYCGMNDDLHVYLFRLEDGRMLTQKTIRLDMCHPEDAQQRRDDFSRLISEAKC